MEELEEKVFEIITRVGAARAPLFEALKLTRAGAENDEKVTELLEESKQEMTEAHHIQTELVQKDLAGEVKISLILVHAQDQLMTVMSESALIEQLIELEKEIRELKEK